MTLDFTDSKHNARMLVERFLETGEQPDFMEYLCFRHCYIEAKFSGYGVDYVINNFSIYAGIAQVETTVIKESTTNSETVTKVMHCYCPCKGRDVISEARRKGLDFVMENGTILLVKAEPKKAEVESVGFNEDMYSSIAV